MMMYLYSAPVTSPPQWRFNPNHDPKTGQFTGGGVSYDRNIKGLVTAHLPDGTKATFYVAGSGLNEATVRHPSDMPVPLYHGTNAELAPGDLIEPGHPGNFVKRMTHVYMTEDPEGVDPKGARGYGKHVYEVRPTGWYGHRRDARGRDWATGDAVEVLREKAPPRRSGPMSTLRFNPNHDAQGKFASAPGAGGLAGYPKVDGSSDPAVYKDWARRNGFVTDMMDLPFPPTAAERALTSYSGNDYQEINGFLRTGEAVSSAAGRLKDKVAAIDSAMQPLKEPVLLARSMHVNAFPGNDPATLVGKTITDDGYLSTSLSHDYVEDLNLYAGALKPSSPTPDSMLPLDVYSRVQMSVGVPAGINAIYMPPYSRSPEQEEILLPRGSTLAIKSAMWDEGTNRWRMTAALVP